MNEHEFIKELQERAKNQENILKTIPFPKVFSLVSAWLGVHPWRLIIPLSFFITFIFRYLIGASYTEFILDIFS